MRVIDSHTGGQPTRVVLDGGPDLGPDFDKGPLSERLARMEAHHDIVRRRCALEPRGSEATVGALLCEPTHPEASAGVIFFNTAGYLGMCGHGTIGLVVTLAHLGRIVPGRHLIETPVGMVETELLDANTVRVVNVESYCLDPDVRIQVDGLDEVRGSVAWGGNWFFLADSAPLPLGTANIPALTRSALAVREMLAKAGITGEGGAEIDHIEFFEESDAEGVDSRNFVLCPGGAYDRSPCGTGTSAKLACLAARGQLAPGEVWVQESIIGSRFEASYAYTDTPGRIIPTLTGQAHICADTRLIFEPSDPFRNGIVL